MTCPDLATLPFPACALELVLPFATGPTAPPHVVRLRNLATDRRERVPASVDSNGTVTVTLTQPLVAGHEYSLELLDVPGDDRHDLTLCDQTSPVVRLRPVLEYDAAGLPVQVASVILQCP